MVLFMMGLRDHTLWDYHEPYVGGIIREMTTSGNWVVPTLNGQPFLEKPPLFYLFGAMVCSVIGHFQPWALRLPSVLLALAAKETYHFLGTPEGELALAQCVAFMKKTGMVTKPVLKDHVAAVSCGIVAGGPAVSIRLLSTTWPAR